MSFKILILNLSDKVITYNSSFKSVLLLLSLSLESEDLVSGVEAGSSLGAETGFWILKGIEACFLRNL